MRHSAILLLMAIATPALATPPPPLSDPALFSFPGNVPHPASAAIAGTALAGRWLGEEPFDNPAGVSRAVSLSPALVRMSRQDLRGDNRSFDESPAFLDVAGGSVGFGVGPLALALYGDQPMLRHEDNAFQRGELGGPVQPAVVQSRTIAREWRAGLAAAIGAADWKWGAAVEWTRRDDQYEYHEVSGSPQAGNRSLTFSGSGVGYQIGARWHPGSASTGPLVAGFGARFVPEIALDGEQRVVSPALADTLPVAVTRAAGLEGGVSVRWRVAPGLHALAGVGASAPREWKAFAVTSGALTTWSIAGEYRDPEVPWQVRFGWGQEQQRGSPEPRASLLGLGLGWSLPNLGLELAVLRRGIDRQGHPRSFDDRVVGTVRVPL